jgi:hypothetical protein
METNIKFDNRVLTFSEQYEKYKKFCKNLNTLCNTYKLFITPFDTLLIKSINQMPFEELYNKQNKTVTLHKISDKEYVISMYPVEFEELGRIMKYEVDYESNPSGTYDPPKFDHEFTYKYIDELWADRCW